MITFATAAKAEAIPKDEDFVVVPIDGVEYKARRPSAAQAALFSAILRRGHVDVTVVLDALDMLIGAEGRRHVEGLIFQNRITISDLLGGGTKLNPGSGLLEQIVEEFANFPSQPSTDSSESPENGGRSSTAKPRRKASTRSSSPSTAS